VGLLNLRRPGVLLALQARAPRIERIVHDHPVVQHRVVIRDRCGETQREREQSRRLRGELGPRCIGATDDQRQAFERRIMDLIDAKEGIEGAQLTEMRERLGARDVVGDCAGLLRHREDASVGT
jgi:hypothetical protein